MASATEKQTRRRYVIVGGSADTGGFYGTGTTLVKAEAEYKKAGGRGP